MELLIRGGKNRRRIMQNKVMLELIEKGTVQELFADLKVVLPSVKALLTSQLKFY